MKWPNFKPNIKPNKLKTYILRKFQRIYFTWNNMHIMHVEPLDFSILFLTLSKITRILLCLTHIWINLRPKVRPKMLKTEENFSNKVRISMRSISLHLQKANLNANKSHNLTSYHLLWKMEDFMKWMDSKYVLSIMDLVLKINFWRSLYKS